MWSRASSSARNSRCFGNHYTMMAAIAAIFARTAGFAAEADGSGQRVPVREPEGLTHS
jgi:hypothetical protein